MHTETEISAETDTETERFRSLPKMITLSPLSDFHSIIKKVQKCFILKVIPGNVQKCVIKIQSLLKANLVLNFDTCLSFFLRNVSAI